MRVRNKETAFFEYLIYLSLLSYLLIDTFAGILLSKGLPNIGIIFKGLLIFMMMIPTMLKSCLNRISIPFFLAYLFLCGTLWFFNDTGSLNQSLTMLFKIFTIPITILYMNSYLNKLDISKIVYVNYFVFLVNIILGTLGFGNGAYNYDGDGVGTKGFFYAGNEVAYTFVCLSFLVLQLLQKRKYFFYFFSFVLSILIGTKSAMLGIILLICLDVFCSVKNKITRIRIILLIGLIVTMVILYAIKHKEDIVFIKYLIFKYNQQKKGTFPILNALLSGRIGRIPIMENLYESFFSLSTFCFGIGYQPSLRLEMDFFEMYYYFGVISLIIIIFIYLIILINSRKNKSTLYFNLLCIFISFIAGHVLYSVMGGVFFALANVLYKKNNLIIKDLKS